MRLGEHDWKQSGEGTLPELTVAVSKFTNHEEYDRRTADNDVAVIELAREVNLETYTPACLAGIGDRTAFDGKTAVVYGNG